MVVSMASCAPPGKTICHHLQPCHVDPVNSTKSRSRTNTLGLALAPPSRPKTPVVRAAGWWRSMEVLSGGTVSPDEMAQFALCCLRGSSWHKISSWRTRAVHVAEQRQDLRPLLSGWRTRAALSHASLLARNEMPKEVMVAIRCARITTLQKPDLESQGCLL